MAPRISRLIFASAALLWGCSSASSLNICHDKCDVQRVCGVLNDAQAQNCHTDCERSKGTYADQDADLDRNCANSQALRQERQDCWHKECAKVATCDIEYAANIVRNCVKK